MLPLLLRRKLLWAVPAAAAALSPAAFNVSPSLAQSDKMKRAPKSAYVPVSRVIKAEVRRTGDPKNPLVLVAWGMVNTGGWGKVRLRAYTVPGVPNSTWHYRLEAIPPKAGRPVTMAFVNVRAQLPLTGIGPHVHTFVITARGNRISITPIPKPAKKGGK